MNPRTGEVLTQRIKQLDPDAAIDTCGPPHFQPFSVIFSPRSSLTDDHARQLGWLLRKLHFLNVANTRITDSGLLILQHSETLRVLTVPFGTKKETIQALLAIPSLSSVRIPLDSVIPETYRSLADRKHFVTDHLTIMRARSLKPKSIQRLHHDVWKQLGCV